MDQGLGDYTYGKGFDKKMKIQDKDKEKLLPIIIAIDFDGTLVENRYPDIGEPILPVWKAAFHAKAQGHKLILWTSRTGDHLDRAVQFCKERGLVFDAVNDNIDEVKALGWDARKVFATMYIDDRMGTVDFGSYFAPMTHCTF